MSARNGMHFSLVAIVVSLAAGAGVLDEHEVTNREYRKFIQATGRQAPEYWQNGTYPAGTDGEPVVLVTWYDAVAYCQWDGGKRLPTVTEFLAACTDNKLTKWGDIWEWTSTENVSEEGPFKALCGPQGQCDCSHEYRPHWKNGVKGFRCARDRLNVTLGPAPERAAVAMGAMVEPQKPVRVGPVRTTFRHGPLTAAQHMDSVDP